MTWHQSWRSGNFLEKAESSETNTIHSSWSKRIILIWLVGTVIFLPVKIINLPFNFELVDGWILIGLPVAIMYLIVRPGQFISPTYLVPIWLVMVSSLLSSFSAPSAANSVTTIVKETYLFIWFITTTILLSKFREKDFRFVMRAWSFVVAIHGLLMIAQFISPDIWRISNSLGGNTARVEGYRAAGLFICDKAGCANKAAFYQILGLVPIMLAGYSKRTTVILGITSLMGMLAAGSMGAVLAFSSGLIVAGLTIAFFSRKLLLVIKYMIQFAFAIMLLGGIFYIVSNMNPNFRDHFERIIVGRYERSSGGRFNLWQRGIDVLLENEAFFWGVGPENFRVVDAAETDNQLHNDTLAFLVERGLIGVSGLALFAGIAVWRAISIMQIAAKSPNGLRLELIVFLAFIAAIAVESLTHQVFRTRELWLILAVQETVYFNLKTSPMEVELTPGKIKIQEVLYDV
jgi:hypothetical protein